jgi:SAM-dependent MidA family methyltransferase
VWDRVARRVATTPSASTRPGVAGPDRGRPALVERIRAEIDTSGPITFARFMELALYDPAEGYYVRRGDRPTRSGDFLTAPETHPLFGRTLARQLHDQWERLGRPDPFVLREFGAGTGALAEAIVDGLRSERSGLADSLLYQPVESTAKATTAIANRVVQAGLPADRIGPAQGSMVGVVLANEFLDALPVHRVSLSEGRLIELYVGWQDGRFVDVPGRPSHWRLGRRLHAEGASLVEGQQAEIRPAVDAWMRDVSRDLGQGYVLVIDYGHPAPELYGRRRIRGTLLAYRGHAASDDPYAAVGEQDLTAHVDLTHLEQAASRVGLQHLGRTSQAEFLAGLGLGELLDELGRRPDTEPQAYADARAAVLRFLDPRATGGFAVEIFGRDVPEEPPLRGLALRLER